MSSEDFTFEDVLKHIDREEQHFVVRLEDYHHSGREVTIVEPHRASKDESSLRDLAAHLKEALGTSGDVENGQIVLHGSLREQVMKALVKIGFSEENIEVI